MSCPDCFAGHVHSGTPKGKVTKLHGLDVYVAEPDRPVKGIVVIIPDAFGWEFVNNRLLADSYADKGNYKVYLPEFMNGRAAPQYLIQTTAHLWKTGNSFRDWIVKPYHLAWALYATLPFLYHNHFGVAWPVIRSFFTAVREHEGAHLPVGAAGFCWGGKYTVNLAHGHTTVDGKPLIDAGFTGHPSLLSIPAEIEAIRTPVSFAIGDRDFALRMPQVRQIKAVVEAKPEAERGEVRIYYGAGHGFCVRADHVLADAEKQATEAEEQALHWFHRFFSQVSY